MISILQKSRGMFLSEVSAASQAAPHTCTLPGNPETPKPQNPGEMKIETMVVQNT
jgi:hypothetical protein